MIRRNLVATVGLCVVALLVAVAVYVGNLKAAEPASKQSAAPQAAAEQIKQLQKRIESLEQRIAALEKRPAPLVWESQPAAPAVVSPIPSPLAAPPGAWPNDGFPAPRFLLIDGKSSDANVIPGR